MSGLIGKKIGMTSIFNEDGRQIACTLLEVGPCVVTQVRTENIDGYSAIQLAYGEKKEKNTPSAMKGHFKNAKTSPKSKVAEFKKFDDEPKLGDTLKVEDIFTEGEFVDVSGTSKGKGFQGVVRRHGFHGVGDASHGQHNRERAPGSIGAASYPSRVFKGMRMAGQMGNKKVKVQNLRVLKVYATENLILLKGAVPGSKGSTVLIEK